MSELCKFFINGVCREGTNCRFSHDKSKSKASNVCRFYLQGTCSYGSSCRYDHIKPKNPKPNTRSMRLPVPKKAPVPAAAAPRTATKSRNIVTNLGLVVLSKNTNKGPKIKEEWATASEFVPGPPKAPLTDFGTVNYAGIVGPATNTGSIDDATSNLESNDVAFDELLCPFAAARGSCPYPECEYIHGDQCPCCLRLCLHPNKPEQAQSHIDECSSKIHDQMTKEAALEASSELECSICMEEVLKKANRSERRFGLLNCPHVFCLPCIRKWRNSDQGLVRACPICRKESFFVTPSETFIIDEEEKNMVIQLYKERMANIDCKHFNFGDGSCPFGTSCFYRHANKDGTLDDPSVRFIGSSEGLVLPMAAVRLSDFLEARDQQSS